MVTESKEILLGVTLGLRRVAFRGGVTGTFCVKTMPKIYRIGTRNSPLALKQVDEILASLKEFYPGFRAEIIEIDTFGDKDKITPISGIEGSDFFTREIDEALLRQEIDLAIHSAKDLPDKLEDGLLVAAITKSIESCDVLISKGNLKIDEFKVGAKIGTSSLRRKKQLKQYRSDFQIVDIRGNIQERINKLYASDLDAILIAAAGLLRLGLEDKITQKLPQEIMQPHPYQGALAVCVRKDDFELINFLRIIDTRSVSGKLY